MSEFSLDTETWLGIGTMIGGAVVAVFGARFGGKKMEETRERVVGLSLAGSVYQTGQSALTQQNVADALKLGRDLVGATKELAKSARELSGSIENFDETTERTARDHTKHQLDDLAKAIDDLKKPDR